MKKLIRIIHRLNQLKSDAGRKFLGTYPANDSLLNLVGYYRDGIQTLCGLIKKRDLKDLTWHELHVLVDATNRDDKLRDWVFEQQQTFPSETTEAQHKRKVAQFNKFLAEEF